MFQFQLAYHWFHLPEFTLLFVLSDNICSMDKSKAIALVFPHLSAASDTVDHSLLLYRLMHSLFCCYTESLCCLPYSLYLYGIYLCATVEATDALNPFVLQHVYRFRCKFYRKTNEKVPVVRH